MLTDLAELYCAALAFLFMAQLAGALGALLFDRVVDWHRRRDGA